jgi:hypothetical protein
MILTESEGREHNQRERRPPASNVRNSICSRKPPLAHTTKQSNTPASTTKNKDEVQSQEKRPPRRAGAPPPLLMDERYVRWIWRRHRLADKRASSANPTSQDAHTFPAFSAPFRSPSPNKHKPVAAARVDLDPAVRRKRGRPPRPRTGAPANTGVSWEGFLAPAPEGWDAPCPTA